MLGAGDGLLIDEFDQFGQVHSCKGSCSKVRPLKSVQHLVRHPVGNGLGVVVDGDAGIIEVDYIFVAREYIGQFGREAQHVDVIVMALGEQRVRTAGPRPFVRYRGGHGRDSSRVNCPRRFAALLFRAFCLLCRCAVCLLAERLVEGVRQFDNAVEYERTGLRIYDVGHEITVAHKLEALAGRCLRQARLDQRLLEHLDRAGVQIVFEALPLFAGLGIRHSEESVI